LLIYSALPHAGRMKVPAEQTCQSQRLTNERRTQLPNGQRSMHDVSQPDNHSPMRIVGVHNMCSQQLPCSLDLRNQQVLRMWMCVVQA
jgi:hypothetical protein